MTRVVILAPINNSPFSRAVSALCLAEPGIEIAGIICRRVLNPTRLRSELKRDGVRLVRKAWRKLVLAHGDEGAADERGFHDVARDAGVADISLSRFARKHGIAYARVGDHNDPESIAALKSMRPDVIAFTGGGIIRQGLIDAAGMGIFNTHMGPLPAFRGMDVVEWPILEAQDRSVELGVTLHFMDKGIDTGPIIAFRSVPIQPGDEMEALRKRFEPTMVSLMMEGIRRARDGSLDPQLQTAPEGRQYFVMHPRLYAETRRKLITRATLELVGDSERT